MKWVEEELLTGSFSQQFKKIKFSRYLFFIFIFIYLIIFIFYFKIFILPHQRWLILANKNNTFEIPLTAPRGLILDRNNKILATNENSYDILIDLNFIKNEEIDFFQEVINKNNLNFFINNNQLIIKDIPKDLASQLLVRYNNVLEVRLVDSYQRKYPLQEGFGNLIGYLGFPSQEEIDKDNLDPNIYIGKLGLEKYYEQYLRGQYGLIVFEKDNKLNIIRKVKNIEPQPGNNLRLTIDSEFQKKAYELMDKYMKENNYRKGGLIVMNPWTGEILSLISYPDFDNNYFITKHPKVKEILKNENQPLFNRNISGLYAPGSVVKPLVAVGALEEKIIDPEKKIYSSGELKIPNPYFPGQFSVFKDWKIHGWVNMKEAIANSVNVYFYTIGGGYQEQKGLGVNNLKKYFQLFGLGEKTGIDFLGEKDGFLPDPETKKNSNLDKTWRLGDTYNLSIGQGDLLVTPLQIAVFTSALATNMLVKPYLVKEIIDNHQRLLFKSQPVIIKKNLVNEKNLKIIQEGMRMTVTEGTAKILNSASVNIAGKSGTPEILGKRKLNAFFTGYAPYEKPEIVMTLFIEEVPLGSVATLPLYRELIDLYFSLHENK
jgi:penicillin-binding protein 2